MRLSDRFEKRSHRTHEIAFTILRSPIISLGGSETAHSIPRRDVPCQNRGDHKKPVFEHDRDRLRFLNTLSQACDKEAQILFPMALDPISTIRPTDPMGRAPNRRWRRWANPSAWSPYPGTAIPDPLTGRPDAARARCRRAYFY